MTPFQKNFLSLGIMAILCVGGTAVQACDEQDGTIKKKCVMAMPMTQAFGNDDDAGMYAPAITKMHIDMGAAPVTGHADVDFVTGMIPHHQGAIDMAKILKEKGQDPVLLKMADEIIKAQESEIAAMKKWLTEHQTK